MRNEIIKFYNFIWLTDLIETRAQKVGLDKTLCNKCGSYEHEFSQVIITLNTSMIDNIRNTRNTSNPTIHQ